ncbi:hypothetical protein ST47_g2836 [Ascochyta rabiei]|uniref:Uncharacterized protein n=1 Tax=Didymella rabiei TaxID=5454 RepID=A0A163IXE9_DIDRA|nr:hypothetical protein ST47_g2836 [Ascochyta rabiei]
MESKTEECETKDLFTNDLTEDFAANQSVTSEAWIHRHDSCNELNAALDEQCAMLTAERNINRNNFGVLSVKHDVLAMKCDALRGECANLQSKFNSRYGLLRYDVTISLHHQNALKPYHEELGKHEHNHTPRFWRSSRCIRYPTHLKRALHISKAAEAQALQLVDQVNHDRMEA